MSLDLSLLPFDCDREDFAFSHTLLSCDRDYGLFAVLQTLPAVPIIPNFFSYLSRNQDQSSPDGESHYGQTTATPYGEPLRYVTVKALLQHTALATRGKAVGKNHAIWAYLACLKPQTKVALYWH